MVSFRGRLINAALRRSRYKDNMIKAIKQDFRRRGYPTDKMRARHKIAETQLSGRDVYHIHPSNGRDGSAAERIILYFHGGAYFYDIMAEHFAALAKLSDESKTTIIAPSYPMAPEHNAQDILDFAAALWRDTRAAHPNTKIILAGDSAGAGLAVQLSQYLKRDGKDNAAALMLWSPWVDVSMTNSAVKAADANSVIIGYDGVLMAAKLYAGKRNLTDPLCSPMYGDLSGLPPMHIWAGGRDLLYPDIIKFSGMVKAAGTPVFLREAAGQNHMWMFMPQPEAKVVMRQTSAAITAA